MSKFLRISMPDADYLIPLDVIARHRAAHYADDFGGDVARSLAEDTGPLFDQHPGEAAEFAVSNMNWSDVKDHASMMPRKTPKLNYELEWLRCDKTVVEI